MEPNKFEEHIREQLLQRQIKPAPGAWEKVAQRLETEEKPRANRFFWAGIAAGFIGLLMIAIWYFNEGVPKSEPDVQIVSAPEEKNEVQENNARESDSLFEMNELNNIVKADSSGPELDNNGNTVSAPPANGKNRNPSKPPIDLAGTESQFPQADSTANLIELKVAEVLAQIEVIEQRHSTVMTDAEVDSLLLNAQREILVNRRFRTAGNVSAEGLLADVEEELDQSFRDQIFERLKSGFEKVRTAVAQRNN